ncbi:hypothetical protein BESB_012370 [Besnoitia besnoiti]|uniref:Uncharacterized protein n=1 Tax=Besnoitia besnoiti TaxID=94643 RepID=A0A2A9M3U4_BESBE|nr:hypothetical protein BESB_012370 [Besnoitia besnoiti]PFH32625.1 hypothetical protein BESB_012370 [Besnoitia besnoiti]
MRQLSCRLVCPFSCSVFRLPAAAPLLCCSFSPFAPALPRSQTSACCSSPASRVAGDLQARLAQSPESGSTSAWGHVGDCLWVARGTWAGRWTSAFANAVAIAASQETNSAAASGTQARPAQRPVVCWGQSHAGGGGLDSDPPGPQTASEDSGLGGAARESNPSRRGGPPAHSRDEQDLALALDAANSRQQHTAPSGGSHEDELGTQVAFVVVHTAQPAACLGAYPSRGAEPGGRFGLQALPHVERECPGAKLAPGAFSPSSGGVQVRLRPCLLEGVEVDGVAQWPDGRMWGLLFDREEFWYRGSQSCVGNSRVTRHPTDRAPVLQLYVHLVTRLGRCGLAVVKRQESAPLTVFEAGGD